ncbi:MAG: hypothetical protein MZV70_60085 [Desulfobacterales bacterium]|nr:hypothetical protein [Desulfobacterales bacterium]
MSARKTDANRCTYYDDIKERYLTDAKRLIQRNLMLEEELAQLRLELSGAKRKKPVDWNSAGGIQTTALVL